jgi:hypothetical protein
MGTNGDLDRYTSQQLDDLHREACNAAVILNQAAVELIKAAAALGDDRWELPEYKYLMSSADAKMAAGDEREGLARSIRAEFTRRQATASA